jgi:hypothetical protein
MYSQKSGGRTARWSNRRFGRFGIMLMPAPFARALPVSRPAADSDWPSSKWYILIQAEGLPEIAIAPQAVSVAPLLRELGLNAAGFEFSVRPSTEGNILMESSEDLINWVPWTVQPENGLYRVNDPALEMVGRISLPGAFQHKVHAQLCRMCCGGSDEPRAPVHNRIAGGQVRQFQSDLIRLSHETAPGSVAATSLSFSSMPRVDRSALRSPFAFPIPSA